MSAYDSGAKSSAAAAGLYGGGFPVFSPSACSRCHHKPCQRLRAHPGENAALASPRDIPADCPLQVPRGTVIDSLVSSLQRYSVPEILRITARGGPIRNSGGIDASTSPAALVRRLFGQGALVILSAGYGTPQYGMLSAWQEKKGAARKKAEEEMAAKAKEAEQEQEKEKPKPELINPVWLGKAPRKDSKEPDEAIDSAAMGSPVWCKVDAQSLMPCDSITFSIYKAGTQDKIETLTGRVESIRGQDGAVVRFPIPENITAKTGPDPKIEFYARQFAHKLETKSPILKIGKPDWILHLELDTENPKAQDDELILLDENDGEVMRVKIADMKEAAPNHVALVFTGVDWDKQYSLIRDHGSDEDGGKDPLFILMTPREIMENHSEA